MPGFQLPFSFNSTGRPLPGEVASIAPILTYTWDVQKVFDEEISRIGTIYLQKCILPSYTFNTTDVRGTSSMYKYASEIVWNDVRIEFYDTSGVHLILRNWRRKVWSPETGFRPAAEYKSDTNLMVNRMDDSLECDWLLNNSWMKAVSWGDLTYTGSDVHSVACTLAYDWATENVAIAV